MKIDELSKKLDLEFMNLYKTIVINGEWGIGKTYFIKEYLKNKNYIYVSLFGIQNLKEFQNEIYTELNKNNIFKNFLSKLVDMNLNIESSLNQEKTFATNIKFDLPLNLFKYYIEKSLEKSLNNKKMIFVIDDLERKSDNIEMKTILGYIEEMSQINNLKIIIVTNENEISKDKQIYETFKEKVIEKTYRINQYSKSAIKEICLRTYKYDNIKIENIIKEGEYIKLIYELANKYSMKNLRILSKSLIFSNSLLIKLNTDNFKKNDIKKIIELSILVSKIICEEKITYENRNETLDKILKYDLIDTKDNNSKQLIIYINDIWFDIDSYPDCLA